MCGQPCLGYASELFTRIDLGWQIATMSDHFRSCHFACLSWGQERVDRLMPWWQSYRNPVTTFAYEIEICFFVCLYVD